MINSTPMNNEQSVKMGEVKKASDSEFSKLLDVLTKELSVYNELSTQLIQLVSSLKPDYRNIAIDGNSNDDCESSNSEGIIGRLWEGVRSLEYSNKEVGETVEHLRSIVGY